MAYEYRIDTQDLGTIANDFTNNDTTQTKDFHGIGLLTLELAQTIQTYMKQNYGVNTALGDTACTAALGNVFDGAGDVIPSHPYVNPPGKICSGLEGIVTTAPPTSAALPINALGPDAITAIPAASKLALGMKPGTWSSLVCFDGGGISGGVATGYTNCLGGNVNFNGKTTDYFDTLQDVVTTAYTGNTSYYAANPSPADISNKRFYFQQWILALVKYLQSADTPAATIATIDANIVDPNNLFLDSAGAGFDTAQYVFRNTVNVGQGQAPTVARGDGRAEQLQHQRLSTSTAGTSAARTALYSALQADPTTGSPERRRQARRGAAPPHQHGRQRAADDRLRPGDDDDGSRRL